MRRRSLVLLVAIVALVAAPSAGASSVYSRVLHAYELHGGIAPCQFSSRELEAALNDIDTYGAQYFQDFTAAVQTALSARASGACLAPAAAAPGSHAPATASFAPLHPGPVTAATSAGVPAPLVAMAVVVGALLLGGAVAAGLRARGGPWVDAWSHAAAEARLRIGGGSDRTRG